MAGPVFAIDQEYFFKMGAYDTEMDGIGSENLELSFRIWMCGGTIEINPCSRVGHIGRRRKQYTQEKEAEAVLRNKMRVAFLWMDDYKWMFFRRTLKAREMLERDGEPDVEKRYQLHDDLECGNFQWYMTEVYPDLYIVPHEDIVLHGEARCSSNKEWCLESNNVHGNPGSVVDVAPCHGLGKGQYYELTEQGEIRQNTISELCLSAKGSEVWTMKCRYPWHDVPDSQKWLVMPDGQILHPHTNLCLTSNLQKRQVTLLKCVKKSTSQVWIIGQKDGYEESPVEYDATQNGTDTAQVEGNKQSGQNKTATNKDYVIMYEEGAIENGK